MKGAAATRGRGPGRGGPRGEAGDEGEHAGAGESGPGRERRAKAAAGGWGMRRIPGKAKRERKGLGGRKEGCAPAPRGRLPTALLSLPALGGPYRAAWQRDGPTPEPHAPSGPAPTRLPLERWKVKLPPRRLHGGPTRVGKEMKFFVSKESSTHMEGPLVLEAAKWMMSAAQGVFFLPQPSWDLG